MTKKHFFIEKFKNIPLPFNVSLHTIEITLNSNYRWWELRHLTHRRCQCSLGQLKQKFFLYCSNPEELHLVSQHFQTSKLWRRHLCFAWSRGRQEEFKWNTRKVAGQGAFQKISCFPSHLTSPLSWDDDGSIFGPTCLSILNISLFSNFFYQEAMFKTRVDVFSLHRLHRFTIIIHQKKKKKCRTPNFFVF